MRTPMLIVWFAAALAGSALAQDSTITIRPGRDRQARLDPRQLPRDVAGEVIRYYNDSTSLHLSGRTRIPAERGIDGDVVVLGGPVLMAGRVSGRLVVINGDLILEPGAVVGGDVLVVGGLVRGEEEAEVGGEIRAYREVLRYRRDGDEMVHAPERDVFPRWARRFRQDDSRSSSSGIFLALGGTYNRVEGAPVVFGPRVDLWVNDGVRFQGDLFGIARSGRDFSLDEGDFGYRIRGEFVFGTRASNLGLGFRAYDLVNSIEPWPLKEYEAGWGAFLMHSDYRDFYRRRGASLFGAWRPSRGTSVQLEGREERHYSIEARDPWTIFRSDRNWRENPAVSDGLFHSATATLRYDTRNDRSAPTAGMYVTAEFEAGRGKGITGPIDPNLVCIQSPCVPADYEDGKLDYRRTFLDARTYMRITPAGRLNLRVAGGGRLGGELLPLQRRVSIGGPDPLPGYGFRTLSCQGADFAGAPALCDRVIAMQAEFRSHLGFDFGPDWANDWGGDETDYEPFHVSGPDIVVFADAGRAWSVGNGPSQIPSNRLPSLSSFLADLGVGIDFGPLGFYFAKAVGRGASSRDVTFTVRMGRRF